MFHGLVVLCHQVCWACECCWGVIHHVCRTVCHQWLFGDLVNDDVCLAAILSCWWYCLEFHGSGFLPVVLVGCGMVGAGLFDWFVYLVEFAGIMCSACYRNRGLV